MIGEPIDFLHEEEPPRFLRAQALPYPELSRVWVRAQLTPFAARPDLEVVILDADASVAASMVMVDVQHTYISLTMHLRQVRPQDAYELHLRLTRDGLVLDRRRVPFALVFVERDEAKAQADAQIWHERGAAIAPLADRQDG